MEFKMHFCGLNRHGTEAHKPFIVLAKVHTYIQNRTLKCVILREHHASTRWCSSAFFYSGNTFICSLQGYEKTCSNAAFE